MTPAWVCFSHRPEDIARDAYTIDLSTLRPMVAHPGDPDHGIPSDPTDQVTISAINRNYKGRSSPGKLWLASPLTMAASAFTSKITAYRPGMFAKMAAERPVLV